MNGNCHIFANSRWAILPPLLLANSGHLGISQRLSDTLQELPRGFPIAFGDFHQRLFDTLLAVLSGCPTAFKSISQRLSAKTWQFPSLFSEGCIYVNVY
jgi:hypothetical protein